MRTMTLTERAYVAGIIDGEGSIEFKWANRIRRDRKGDMKYYPNEPKWQDQHRWRVNYHGVYRTLKQVYPYLIVKKEKAKLVVDHYDKKFKEKKYGRGKFGQ